MADAMSARGLGEADLAAEVGCSAALVGHIKRGLVVDSKFIPKISDVLKIERPHVEVTNKDLARALRAFRTILDEGDKHKIKFALQFLEDQARRAKSP